MELFGGNAFLKSNRYKKRNNNHLVPMAKTFYIYNREVGVVPKRQIGTAPPPFIVAMRPPYCRRAMRHARFKKKAKESFPWTK